MEPVRICGECMYYGKYAELVGMGFCMMSTVFLNYIPENSVACAAFTKKKNNIRSDLNGRNERLQ